MHASTNVLQLLEHRVAVTPEATAVVDGRSSMSYGELANCSRRVGSALLAMEPRPRAALIFMPKNCDALCAIMGALYAGIPYVPVDPSIPLGRLEKILYLLGASALICVDGTDPKLEGEHPDVSVCGIGSLIAAEEDFQALEVARAAALETDPAYVLFTSGSTGVPKGVAISHRAILSFIDEFVSITGICEHDRIASQAPLDFDVSTKDIYGALATGATLVLIPRELFMRPAALMDFLCEQGATVLVWAVAALCLLSAYHALRRDVLPELRIVAFSGEVMPGAHLKAWRKAFPHADFLNLYGPTEITCNCLYHRLDPARDYKEGIPLGVSFPHCGVSIVDAEGNEVTRADEPGEIVVRGPSLALGYVGMPEVTARAFVQDPLEHRFPVRAYLTGDLAAYSPEGELFFRGRKDNQIKYQGHRIELEEIDVAFEAVVGVDRCRCVFDQKRERLLAFFEGHASEKDVHAAALKSLPQHMVPGVIRKVDDMPLNKNGKVDRAGLLARELGQAKA